MLVVVNIVLLQNQQFQHQWRSKAQKARAEIKASLQNSECRRVNVSTSGRPGLQNLYYSFIRQCDLLSSTFSPLLAVSSGRLTPNHYPSPRQRAVKSESSSHGLLLPFAFPGPSSTPFIQQHATVVSRVSRAVQHDTFLLTLRLFVPENKHLFVQRIHLIGLPCLISAMSTCAQNDLKPRHRWLFLSRACCLLLAAAGVNFFFFFFTQLLLSFCPSAKTRLAPRL